MDHEPEDEQPDEHHHHSHHPSMMIFGPFGRPMTEDEISQMNLQQTTMKHDLYRIFAELDEDQLIALRGLFNICSREDCGTQYAEHFEGIAVGILHAKFGVCISCGVNHEREASDIIAKEGNGDTEN